jgi:hypothetical protein
MQTSPTRRAPPPPPADSSPPAPVQTASPAPPVVAAAADDAAFVRPAVPRLQLGAGPAPASSVRGGPVRVRLDLDDLRPTDPLVQPAAAAAMLAAVASPQHRDRGRSSPPHDAARKAKSVPRAPSARPVTAPASAQPQHGPPVIAVDLGTPTAEGGASVSAPVVAAPSGTPSGPVTRPLPPKSPRAARRPEFPRPSAPAPTAAVPVASPAAGSRPVAPPAAGSGSGGYVAASGLAGKKVGVCSFKTRVWTDPHVLAADHSDA